MLAGGAGRVDGRLTDAGRRAASLRQSIIQEVVHAFERGEMAASSGGFRSSGRARWPLRRKGLSPMAR
jgi:hypothetical protein